MNAIARHLTEFTGKQVTSTQVYNHLRKLRARWVKVCRLKELSRASWDEDLCMITLDPEHYNGHVKVIWFSIHLFLSYCLMQMFFLY